MVNFPDDIITNILSRLPAKNVMQCRLVCKGWLDVTLDRDFVDLHFRCHSNIPMILLPKLDFVYKVDHLLDKWWEQLPAPVMSKIHSCHFDSNVDILVYRARFSHAGLFVSQPSGRFICILNPVNCEHMFINVSGEKKSRNEIYGVYFHPSQKEYCSLWMISSPCKQNQYKVLNLGSNPCFRTLNNPFACRGRMTYPPLFMDKYLYWLIGSDNPSICTGGRGDIMQFDIISEKFTIMICPVPQEIGEVDYGQTHLLNIDGTLTFLLICQEEESTHITIWRLENHEEQLWKAVTYTLSIVFSPRVKLTPIAVVDGKIALATDNKLTVLNLMQESKSEFWEMKYYCWLLCLSHQMSLASLRNCMSYINLNNVGHEVDNESNQCLKSDSAEGSSSSIILDMTNLAIERQG